MADLDHIMELRAELASWILTRRERAQIERELKGAIAAQAESGAPRTAAAGMVGDQAPPA